MQVRMPLLKSWIRENPTPEDDGHDQELIQPELQDKVLRIFQEDVFLKNRHSHLCALKIHSRGPHELLQQPVQRFQTAQQAQLTGRIEISDAKRGVAGDREVECVGEIMPGRPFDRAERGPFL